jgi:hypothetical protein
VSVEPIECVDCGAVWHSAPAAHASAVSGGCLVCGGKLVPASEAPRAEDPRPGDASKGEGED